MDVHPDQNIYPEEMSGTRQAVILNYCHQVRILSLHGVLLFTPSSIAFADFCLIVLLLTHIIEIIITRQFTWPHTPLNRPLFFYVIVTLISSFFAVNVKRSLGDTTNLLDVGIFFLIYLSLQNRSQIQKYTGLLLVYVTLTASYGIIQHYLEVDLFRLSRPISFLKHVNDDLRAPVRISGFSSYMTFAGQLAMTVSMIFAYVLCTKSRLIKGWWLLSLVVTSFALLWTYTRSAWLGAICGIVVLGIMKKGKKFLVYALLIILVFAGVVLIQQVWQAERKEQFQQERLQEQSGITTRMKRQRENPPSDVLSRFASMFRTKENRERIYTWASTLAMIKDHPLTGIGHGNYSDLCGEYRTIYGDFEFTSDAHAHNNLLQIAVTGGIPLLGCFIWLWWVIFRSTYQIYQRRSSAFPALSLGVFGALIAFFVQGFFEHNFGDSEVAMMMWILLAFVLKFQELAPTKT